MKLSKIILYATSVMILLLSCAKEDNPIYIDDSINTGTPIIVSNYFNENLLLISHRGLKDYPENTFVAVNAAVLSGFKAVECDICMTSDNVFVLQHDSTIDRCSNGTGKVHDMTYDELLPYDFGSWKGEQFRNERIARLDDLLDYFKEKHLIIELDLADESRFKREWIPALYDLVKKKGMLGQTMFTATQEELESFLYEPREMIISVSGVYHLSDAKRALPLKDKVTLCNFSVPKNYLTNEISNFAHENGVKVKSWTTTSQSETDNCLAYGADYVITEVPLQ